MPIPALSAEVKHTYYYWAGRENVLLKLPFVNKEKTLMTLQVFKHLIFKGHSPCEIYKSNKSARAHAY